ncbi:MAG: VOC family protein [Gammaproteobacteria bacterium]|nr:VOC family protein [Gammaproteobacteria bacterium]
MPSIIIPTLKYHDAAAAVDWLCDAFGFERHLVVSEDEGRIAHAQLTLGDSMIMLGSTADHSFDRYQKPPAAAGGFCTQSAYIIVDDVDAHCARARARGAHIVLEPADQDYGGRLYSCLDPESHLWNFGSYDPWV